MERLAESVLADRIVAGEKGAADPGVGATAGDEEEGQSGEQEGMVSEPAHRTSAGNILATYGGG
jgi:hypothetical protein